MITSPADFDFYKKWLHEKSGLALKEDKAYLLESRLVPVLAKWGFRGLPELAATLAKAPEKKLTQDVIDAMMTNETMFFRDDRPFTHLRTAVLPALLAARAGTRQLRIWSAACSTGQEPYSLAMSLAEHIRDLPKWNIQILATDISDVALRRAREGCFSQFEIQRGLPPAFADRYFDKEGKLWRVRADIRALVRFENFNLLDRMEHLGIFDVIFCRNVLIYFNGESKKQVLAGLRARLAPDGALMIGGSETALGVCPGLTSNPACPGLYSVKTAAT